MTDPDTHTRTIAHRVVDAIRAAGIDTLFCLPGVQNDDFFDALVDAPDIDSVEHANRELTDRLIEAADLALFVTTATRYADRVPWGVLERVRERGLPLLVIVNRMPPDASDRADILADVERLLVEAGLDGVRSGVGTEPTTEIVTVPEGALDPLGDRLATGAIAPVVAEIDRLRADRDARIALATRALTGSLTGLGETLDQIADDAEHESIDVEALRRIADRSYETALEGLRHEVARGTFLGRRRSGNGRRSSVRTR